MKAFMAQFDWAKNFAIMRNVSALHLPMLPVVKSRARITSGEKHRKKVTTTVTAILRMFLFCLSR